MESIITKDNKDNKELKSAKEMFPERLKKIRESGKLTVPELAELIGVTRQTLAKYEKGESIPNLDTLELISKNIKVSISYLVGESETQVNEIAKINIAEYTGLSQEAIYNLHFSKLLNETYWDSVSNETDEDESHKEKRPYYYYISALLSNSSPLCFEKYENDLEYYCKATKQLREVELLYNKTIERKDKMDGEYHKYNRKTNGLMQDYYSVLDIINDKTQDPDADVFCLSADSTVNYGALSVEELIEMQNELEKSIINILHKPKIKEFYEDHMKVKNEWMEYFDQIETLKNRKARAFMNIFEILNNLSNL